MAGVVQRGDFRYQASGSSIRLLQPHAILPALLAAAVCGWTGADAVTRYVDDATCPSAGNGTQASPYCRIQDAICASTSGDMVSVAPGTYLEAIRMRPGVSVISQGG
ncbi:MAG TPA: hypothetical protein VJV23_02210, partial [Candidatus Polarisedimenticolia bacterium]|nr:hypothetical protein [Candidatus Polarisedimenticolia bacterium]